MNKYRKFILDVMRHPRAFYECLKGGALAFGRNELLQEFSGTGSDKGFPGHNYARVYDALLYKKREDIESFCEIGLLLNPLHGGQKGEQGTEVHDILPSLSVWRSYFPNAKIVGFDIKQFNKPKDEKITVIQGDQKFREDLYKIIEEQPNFDIIIDDALHASEHQQVTFSYLFQYLKPGGIFFIEDLCSQLPQYEKPEIPKTRDLLRELQVNKTWSSPLASDEEKEHIESSVAEVHFFDSLKYYSREVPALVNDNLVAIIKK